jgi:hypothetical protein
MAEFLIIVGVVAGFLVIFYSAVVHEKRSRGAELEEKPPHKKAA